MRVTGWQARLQSEIDSARLQPFAWGTWDCIQWCAIAVQAMTGIDYRTRFPKYASKAEALQILTGAGGIDGLLTGCLGDSKAASEAQPGDVVTMRPSFVPGSDEPSCGIVDLGGHAVLKAHQVRGLATCLNAVPGGAVLRAWPI